MSHLVKIGLANILFLLVFPVSVLEADEGHPIAIRMWGPDSASIWPDLAPGESSRGTGDLLPARESEAKPIQRVSNVRLPTIDVYPAKNNPTGAAVLILPGGGFTYVVPDLEGSEAAQWLNEIGLTAFVLRYRTKESAALGEPLWKRPLQDTQRAMRWIRSQASKWLAPRADSSNRPIDSGLYRSHPRRRVEFGRRGQALYCFQRT